MKADSKAFLLTNFVTSVITQNIFKYVSHRCDSISNHFQARTRPNCQKMWESVVVVCKNFCTRVKNVLVFYQIYE